MKVLSDEPLAIIRMPGSVCGNMIVTSVSGRWMCGDVEDGISVRLERGPYPGAGFVVSVSDLRHVLALVDEEQAKFTQEERP